ncbi:hypothetical protein INT47_011510 [Mucor saturninus]|uniref:Endonuclease/exonuclease/phosphatase domain-containing protein n=1 Tax=Mucor saturninus TaxID=64648 RepID=A0A8H7QKL2_9FUNG|nr:hypothetical protein INT47_011510 [Mucor saturninus]
MNLHNSNHSTITNSHTTTTTESVIPSPSYITQEPFLVESFLSSTIRIATLNCRSLVKTNEPSRRQDFIRFLRKQNPPLDIITLQETHASTTELKLLLDNLFQTKQTVWSKQCGIVCFNPSLQLTPDFITIDQRVIKCTITHVQRTFDPLTVVTIYAPAQLAERQQFFSGIIEMPFLRSSDNIYPVDLPSSTPRLPTRTIITGDFNFSLSAVSNPLSGTRALANHQVRWNQELQANFRNCLDSATISPTFRRGQQMSTIDYIYSTTDLFSDKIKSNVEFISPTWTDHALLTFSFKCSFTHLGKGLWRANPALASNPKFLDSMHHEIDKTCLMFHPNLSPQLRWDRIKETVKKVARKTGRHHADWRKKQLDVLQKKRTYILNDSLLTPAVLQFKLSKVEAKIQGLQEEITTNDSLRAQKFWRETGESSPSFLKRPITTRLTKSFIPELIHPNLYTPDDIDVNATDQLANTIPNNVVLYDSQREYLLTEFTKDDLLEAAKRTP